ncbi:MAG TPA: hypothetical protein VNH11_28025 [Pirellulales bacterium]|nr:hypothetical protein [Pirellulales bacterium]
MVANGALLGTADGPNTFRYPALAVEHGQTTLEDWFNHVVPALMLFRCYVLTRRLVVKEFTLQANSSTGLSARRRDRLSSAPRREHPPAPAKGGRHASAQRRGRRGRRPAVVGPRRLA